MWHILTEMGNLNVIRSKKRLIHIVVSSVLPRYATLSICSGQNLHARGNVEICESVSSQPILFDFVCIKHVIHRNGKKAYYIDPESIWYSFSPSWPHH